MSRNRTGAHAPRGVEDVPYYPLHREQGEFVPGLPVQPDLIAGSLQPVYIVGDRRGPPESMTFEAFASGVFFRGTPAPTFRAPMLEFNYADPPTTGLLDVFSKVIGSLVDSTVGVFGLGELLGAAPVSTNYIIVVDDIRLYTANPNDDNVFAVHFEDRPAGASPHFIGANATTVGIRSLHRPNSSNSGSQSNVTMGHRTSKNSGTVDGAGLNVDLARKGFLAGPTSPNSGMMRPCEAITPFVLNPAKTLLIDATDIANNTQVATSVYCTLHWREIALR